MDEKRATARIVKVNHAGEYGAIRIYRAQLWMARRFYPDLVPFLSDTLGHEIKHCALFRQAMPSRQTRPCRVMALWGNGGYVLGLITALCGRQGVWLCTAAVEATVHRHLEDQLQFLQNRDAELFNLIDSIQAEELSHLHHAEERIEATGLLAKTITWTITLSTEAVIWLSTWRDSSRMAKLLKPTV